MRKQHIPGQISLFDGLVQNPLDKPIIGTSILFLFNEKIYPAVVKKHCGADFFYIEFTERKPADDNPRIDDTPGWHISMRSYKKNWDYGYERVL